MTKKIAIIEDHPTTRNGLKSAINDSGDMEVSVAVASVEEFMRHRHSHHDVVILDLGLRGGGTQGASAVAALTAIEMCVLVVSMHIERKPVMDAIKAGACGYVTKEAEPDEIIRAIATVSNGKVYFSATVAAYLLQEKNELTERQQEVLRLVAQGETTREIALILGIAETTVNNHLNKIRDVTGSRRRADLTRYAIEQGILPFDGTRKKENKIERRFPRRG